MRIALVSPYSWTYPGGVTRHIEALAEQLLAAGHDARVLAPYDPDDRLAARLHRGARPARRPAPEYFVPLGRTIGYPMNGAVSNLVGTPEAIIRLRRELESGYDVVHVHEPVAPVVGWDALTSTRAPLVGTFHCYSESRVANNVANLLGARRVLNHLRVRIAVSEAAAWTGRRFYGGRYRIVPNGVDVPEALEPKTPGDHLRIAFVGQALDRKGLPVLLRAFEALRDHVPASLTIVGASERGGRSPAARPARRDRLGRVDDTAKRARAPGRRRALRALAGRRELRHGPHRGLRGGHAGGRLGHRGLPRRRARPGRRLLVPRGDATELAELLRDLWLEPARRAELSAAAAAQRPAVRLAERGRGGRPRLRGRGRGPRARRACAPAWRCAPGCAPPTSSRASPRGACRPRAAEPPGRRRAAGLRPAGRLRPRLVAALLLAGTRSGASASTASSTRS